MKHGSLFSGIGGFDLAASWMGWENVFHCEWNPFCQKVLKHHFPNSIPYNDITKTDFTIHRGSIDVLTGGFPCQPFSVAGKQRGKEDERFLWHEMLRAIKEIQPGYIVAENVYGILNNGGGLVFEQVCSEMENEGYEVQPYLLPACGIGAWHKRERFWFIANKNPDHIRRNSSERKKESGERGQREFSARNLQRVHRESLSPNALGVGTGRIRNQGPEKRPQGGDKLLGELCRIFPDTNSERGCSGNPKRQDAEDAWQSPGGTEYWNWDTEPNVGRVANGVSGRVDRLKALGNAIVPQVAMEIFKAIQQTVSNPHIL